MSLSRACLNRVPHCVAYLNVFFKSRPLSVEYTYIHILCIYIYIYIYYIYILYILYIHNFIIIILYILLYIYIYNYFWISKLNPHTNSFMLLEIYIQLATTYIYTRLLFGQAFLELVLFYLSSSNPEVFCKDVLKNFAKFSRNLQCHNLRKLQVSRLPAKKETPAHVLC